jgi:two-component system chemotaxis sensor kinase CheA
VVRDLSALCGKKVRVVAEGKETELDRSLLEAVKDPLTHLVRNAVDHGVEAPEVRVANGKGAEGTLTLNAHHEGGNVIVEVMDDGGGMNPDVIGRIAIERGVITRDQLAAMEPREVLHLVFQPGFSTAAAVTNVSGRGVGMDVVKTNIERIGGAVDVESTIGTGTTWRLTIPLTLAIIQALTVDCGSERYAIPQSAVRELVFLDGESGQCIEYISGCPVYRLRGKLLPLVRLDETLGFPPASDERAVYVAVVQADSRRFGLVVDRVLNTEEIVVKPLAQRFKDVGVYAGATILGDGRVALILDVQALARRARLNVGAGERADGDQAEDALGGKPADRLLVVAVGDRRIAIPLDMVTRLESFSLERLERVGHRDVVQYRDAILPIVRLTGMLGTDSFAEPGQLLVVVYTENGRSAGLAVDRILDIVEDTAAARMELDDHAVTGSTVVHQRVTELLNVRNAILAADPMFYADSAGIDGCQGSDLEMVEV